MSGTTYKREQIRLAVADLREAVDRADTERALLAASTALIVGAPRRRVDELTDLLPETVESEVPW